METTSASTTTTRRTARMLALVAAALLTLFLLPACTVSTDIDQAKATADGFLSAVEDGDVDKADVYCTSIDDVFGADIGIDNIKSAFFDSAGMSEDEASDEVKDAFDSLYNTIIKNLIDSYDITSVDVDDDTATVRADVTWGYNPEQLDDIDTTEVEGLVNNYFTEHNDELQALYASEGEDAVMQKYYNDVIPQALQMYENAINNLDPVESAETFTLAKQGDGSWRVTGAA